VEGNLFAALKLRSTNKIGTMVALGCGPNINTQTLKEITDNVLRISDTNPDSLQQFFKWVSSSIQKTSQRIDSKADDGNLGRAASAPVIKIG